MRADTASILYKHYPSSDDSVSWSKLSSPVLKRISKSPATMLELKLWAKSIRMPKELLFNAQAWLELNEVIERVPDSKPPKYRLKRERRKEARHEMNGWERHTPQSEYTSTVDVKGIKGW